MPDELWYSPREIIFTPEQVCWLLDHVRTLKSGYYPREPISTISEPPGGHNRRASAYFETPAQIYSELTERLERCGQDGLILLAREGLEMDEYEIGKYFNQPEHKIRNRANTALRYVSGKSRKWQKRGKYEAVSYHEFRHRKPVKTSANFEASRS